MTDVNSLGLEASRVCISCWHWRGQLCHEDEGHTRFECPDHDCRRELFLQELAESTRAAIGRATPGKEKLLVVLASTLSSDWQVFGKLAARIRQARRRMRTRFQARQNRLLSIGFSFRKIAWRQPGNFVCRHGVFFAIPQVGKCPCMAGPFDPGSTQ